MPAQFSLMAIVLAVALAVAIETVTFVLAPRCNKSAAAGGLTIGTVILIHGCR